MTENFLAILFDGRPRDFSTTAISNDGDFLAGFGLDGEFNFVKVSEIISTGSFEGLETGEILVGRARFNGVDGDVEEGHQQGKFVNDHILQHTFTIAFKALAKARWCVFIRVVADKRNGSTIFGRILAGLSDVFADILVVSHQNSDASGLGFVAHRFQFSHGGSTWLFEVDGGALGFNALRQKLWIVGGTTRNESQTLGTFWQGWQVGHGSEEFNAVLGLGFFLPFSKFRSTWSLGARTQEPRFDDVRKNTTGAFVFQELHRVVPSHTPRGRAAANENNLGLVCFQFDRHDDDDDDDMEWKEWVVVAMQEQ
mmetsp:Transcript_5315/g.14939  ORF Transcript_5315/g.14939 Transcript_5315/m.14939 type:complete len:311 (+) Transcript_5315:2947-3879(+)